MQSNEPWTKGQCCAGVKAESKVIDLRFEVPIRVFRNYEKTCLILNFSDVLKEFLMTKPFSVNDMIALETKKLEPEDVAELLQRAINDGNPWKLQGSYGGFMLDAIARGECMLGEQPAEDSFGGRIPTRFEIQEGCTGSRAFVVEKKGESWAQMLEDAGKPKIRNSIKP